MSQFLFLVDISPPGISFEDPAAAASWFGFEASPDVIQLPSQGTKKLSRNSGLFPVPRLDVILTQLMETAQKSLGFAFDISSFRRNHSAAKAIAILEVIAPATACHCR